LTPNQRGEQSENVKYRKTKPTHCQEIDRRSNPRFSDMIRVTLLDRCRPRPSLPVADPMIDSLRDRL
jgi:hypothetical protein